MQNVSHMLWGRRWAKPERLNPSIHVIGRQSTGDSLKTVSLTINRWRIQNKTPRCGCSRPSMESLTVWFGQDEPPGHWTHVLLWESFRPSGAPSTWRSLPEEIHLNRDALRAEHLRWSHDVGVTQVKKDPLRQGLLIRPQLSYWWMTLPASHALEPDSPVYNAVRLRVLERIAVETQTGCITIANADRASVRLIRSWGRDSGRRIVVNPKGNLRKTRKSGSWGLKIKVWLLNVVPPAGALVGLVTTGSPTGAKARDVSESKSPGIVMIDYLAHLRPEATTDSVFISNYWGPLVNIVQSTGPTQWLHLSANRGKRSDVETDIAMMDAWSRPSRVSHSLLHAHVTFRLRMRALRDYLRVVVMGLRTRRKRELLWDRDAHASMWPVFRSQYRDDWYGMNAFHNCLALNLFEDFFNKLPNAPLGIYLFENQPWEMALIHAWRTGGHGRLIGFAHSTIPFWSTRIFKDSRDLWSKDQPGGMLCPDQVAVNGPCAREALRLGGYPTDRLIDVEAVRYLEEPGVADRAHSAAGVLLVFGEYNRDSTERIIDVVEQALEVSGFRGDVTFRSHPAMTPHWDHLPRGFSMDSNPSSHDALRHASIVVCGALSSVAIEALRLGKPTYLVADGRTFASSPAEGFEPSWVFGSEDLATRLREWRNTETGPDSRGLSNYFWLGLDLSRWRALLNSDPSLPTTTDVQ